MGEVLNSFLRIRSKMKVKEFLKELFLKFLPRGDRPRAKAINQDLALSFKERGKSFKFKSII